MAVLQQWLAKLNALSVRERSVIFIALIAAITFVWYVSLMEPVLKEKGRLNSRIDQQQESVTELSRQVEKALQGQPVDPHAQLRERIAGLEFDIDKLNERLEQMTGGLLEKQQMSQVVREILARQTDLRLISVESLETKPLIETQGTQTRAAGVAQVFRHGVRVVFKGGYLETLRYLKALEELPWRLYWGNIEYEIADYPNGTGTLVVYTLSLSEGWIGV